MALPKDHWIHAALAKETDRMSKKRGGMQPQKGKDKKSAPVGKDKKMPIMDAAVGAKLDGEQEGC